MNFDSLNLGLYGSFFVPDCAVMIPHQMMIHHVNTCIIFSIETIQKHCKGNSLIAIVMVCVPLFFLKILYPIEEVISHIDEKIN